MSQRVDAPRVQLTSQLVPSSIAFSQPDDDPTRLLRLVHIIRVQCNTYSYELILQDGGQERTKSTQPHFEQPQYHRQTAFN